eukprot:TRINITY_DN15511_c0_g1_i1.p1 TRINITY_DN15511_c0_g1~~TRINITY_DN15511_c0_g1_i1.p1  ORF type:complete len:218 (-),score=33.73 TRINITY_DN15511_c0_g1_i1:5-658(-)
MKSILQLLLVICFVLGQTWAQSNGYTFPTKYKARVYGYVQDFFLNNQKAYTNGWIFVDYTIPSMRADEVWDQTSIYKTGLGSLGVLSDSHMFLSNYNYFFYTNSSGGFCFEDNSIGIMPQNTFSSPSTYVKNTTFLNTPVYEYQSTYGPTALNVVVNLYVSISSNLPVALYTVVDAGGLGKEYSEIIYLEFNQVPDFTDPQVFALPSYCPKTFESIN